MRAYPELAGLNDLRSAGWSFRAFADDEGEIGGLVGWRDAATCVDVLWIFDQDDCRAARFLPAATAAPGEMVWNRTGDLATCVAAVLGLLGA
ncbi:hypothetical protein OOZ19_07140 [Saccharopolyspora sp. NFXS83]|uniref:hypothetical protein n=1 Tax=Saccharopolyspora sp. NFXS83 TaxID=2993560 RepID=UPI00224A6B4F|nr:hypothetical protein [Saccharopolyspora sp. NFXS83]MCX2730009.1 hypothetical protein [Saccharopolyspora sp. NFXS83]